MTVDEQIKAAYENKVTKVHNNLVRTTGVRFLGNVSLANPVGNPDLWKINQGKKRGDKGYVGADYTGGRSRANWNIAVNRVDDTTTESIEAPDYNIIGMNVTSSYKQGDTIYVSNNLPYMAALNDGHSTQAPENFVEKNLDLAIRQAQAAEIRGAK